MPASQARVLTSRASRYLAQLCSHSSQMSRAASHRPRKHSDGGAPPAARLTSQTGADGVIDFGWGRCTLHATSEALILHAEAGDQQQLRQIQDGLTARLERIGRRDQLTLSWTLAPSGTGPDAAAGEHGTAAAIMNALMAPASQADPYPLYAKALQAGPVSAIGDGWFLVCGYAAASRVLRDPGFGLPDPAESLPGDGVLSSLSRSILRANPPDHPRMRSLISEVFTPRRVSALRRPSRTR
jgi:hypothetical protein